MKLKTSVGTRLVLLVAFQTAIAGALVLTALGAFARIANDTRYIYQFQLLSLADIGEAMGTAAILETQRAPDSHLVGALNAFYERYRRKWQTANGTTPDAIRFRNDL